MSVELPTNEAINAMVFDATVATIKGYCERRLGEGATDKQLNDELKGYVLLVSAWARRQRTLLRLMLLDDDAPTHRLQ